MQDILSNMFLGLLAIIVGFLMTLIPGGVYALFVSFLLLYLGVSSFWLLIRFFRKKNKGDILMAILSFIFFVILSNHQNIPQNIMQLCFGIYCILCGMASLVQLIINYLNGIQEKVLLLLFSLFYFILGIYVLFLDENPYLLMRAFGFYLMILGARYIEDGTEAINPLTKYEWKRKFRITFPAILCALFPDWALNAINRYLESGQEFEYEEKTDSVSSLLHVFVHVGPYGFQKVGHICFSYLGLVYSYGNYDSSSFRLNQTIGDGVFFKVPEMYYIPNAMEAEKNTIFEYGIQLNKEQEQILQTQLIKLEEHSYRWYCRLEKENGYQCFEQYKEDYPSRLHYKTGAKLYKFSSGKFKTYWALGDNCALFTDRVLGCLGADILSIRGIISPGTYLEWLQKEYMKKNSPIVSRRIHSIEKA